MAYLVHRSARRGPRRTALSYCAVEMLHLIASLLAGLRDCGRLVELYTKSCGQFSGQHAELCELHRVGRTACALNNNGSCTRDFASPCRRSSTECHGTRNASLLAKTLALEQSLADAYASEGYKRPAPKYVPTIGIVGVEIPGLSTGGGSMRYDLELFVRLSEALPGTRVIVGIGNAFGYSTLALGMLFPTATILVFDAETEGSSNALGSALTRRIAHAHGLDRLQVLRGKSPWDLPRMLRAALPGPIDIAFIDGLHTPEQQLLDYSILRPILRPRHHVAILHDVRMAKMEWSLGAVEHVLGDGGAVREYQPVNGCNLFGTTLATPREGWPF